MTQVDDILASFFSPQAGQARRQWLDAQTNALMYYVPPEIRPQLNAVASMTPVAAYGDSVAASRRMMDGTASPGERWQAAGDMAAGVLGLVAPGYIAGKAGAPLANALGEIVTGYGGPARNALADFGASEDGGVNLNGKTWFHGTPDARAVKSGGFERGRAVYMTDDPRIAGTYADPRRAWDYQRAEPEVLRLTSSPERVVDINAAGDTFKGINADAVAAGLRASGVPEEQITEAIDGARRSDGRLSTANLEDILRKFDFQAADISRVRDSYTNAEKARPATVRMVLSPELITILKKYGALPAAFMAGAAMQPGQAQAGPATPPRAEMGASGRW